MKLGVMNPVLNEYGFEDALKYLNSLGVDTIEIGAGGYHATGSVKGIYEYGCELFRKRMECAIMLEAAKAVEE